MWQLVKRTTAGVIAGIALLAIVSRLLGFEGEGPTPHAAAQLLADSYPREALTAGRTVEAVEALPGRVQVRLQVPDDAAAGFLSMPDGARLMAFGPDCPAPSHPVWRALEAGGDVHLRPVSESGEVIMPRLSCREWNRFAERS